VCLLARLGEIDGLPILGLAIRITSLTAQACKQQRPSLTVLVELHKLAGIVLDIIKAARWSSTSWLYNLTSFGMG
jgi:hypothetical protein